MSARKVASLVMGFLIVLSTARPSNAGDLVLAWDPPSDGITTGYLLSYGAAPGSYAQQLNVGYTTSFTLSGLSDGTTYYFVVRAYDAAGDVSDPSAEVAATVTPSVPPVVTTLSLSSSVASPQLTGTTINWLSTATGGVAPYQFQWALYKAGSWTVWPWATASTWTWTPTAAGTDYQVKVAVRSSGSASTTGEMTQSMPYTVTAPASGITLSSAGFKVKGVKNANLTWSGASGSSVDVYRSGSKVSTTANDGAYTDAIGGKGSGTFIYKVCAAGTTTCSNDSTVVF